MEIPDEERLANAFRKLDEELALLTHIVGVLIESAEESVQKKVEALILEDRKKNA